jgi:hypothetical protein
MHYAFEETLSYGDFTIILPSEWNGNCLKNQTLDNYDGAEPDITILNSAKHKVWTQQMEECGVEGEKIYVNYESITDEAKLPELFNMEWLKYRYGIFDSFVDPMYFNQTSSQDSSFNYVASRLLSGFNKYEESQPNSESDMLGVSICDRLTPNEVFQNHPDFQNELIRKHELKLPKFHYAKRTMTRYIIIIDDSVSSERDQHVFVHDALRKFIEKDLQKNSTEVGIHLLSENNTKITQQLLKTIRYTDEVEEVLSKIWYMETKYVNIPQCSLFVALEKSIEALEDRSAMHGNAENVIMLISPGMPKCADKAQSVVTNANRQNIKIVTLNYPSIAFNRVEMDQLAHKTSGKAYTIFEQKQNERQSLLTTFYELTNILLEVSSQYAASKTNLPTEIYRKELHDSMRDDNRPIHESFSVDSSIRNFNFYVYLYDRRERNLEKGMHLRSPSGEVFSTFRELRAEYHQIEILTAGNFTTGR